MDGLSDGDAGTRRLSRNLGRNLKRAGTTREARMQERDAI